MTGRELNQRAKRVGTMKITGLETEQRFLLLCGIMMDDDMFLYLLMDRCLWVEEHDDPEDPDENQDENRKRGGQERVEGEWTWPGDEDDPGPMVRYS